MPISPSTFPASVKPHTYTIPIPGVKKRRFCHFSDTHLSVWDALSSPGQVSRALETEQGWRATRDYFALKHEGALPPERLVSAQTHFENLLFASRDCDCLILTGDLLDYISFANVRYLDRQLSAFPRPYMAVRGNHENPAHEHRHEQGVPPAACLTDRPVQVIDFGDLLLLGLDDSDLKMTSEQLNALEACAKTGKPLLVAMHAPVCTEMNRSALSQAGDHDYFILNHSGCPAENTEFVKMLLDEKTNVRAVFTGHLHFQCAAPLKHGLWQYGVSQGIAGHLNEYIIGE